MEFYVRYLALFILFFVIGDIRWFWMGSLHKNVKLMRELLKCPFLVLLFSCYILVTFLMMLSALLLSMLMILLCTLNVVRHLIYGNNLNWLLNLNLIYETLDCERKWLLDLSAGKTQLVSFDWSNKAGAIDVKMDGSVLEEKSYFKVLWLTFSSKLDWGS